MQSSSREHLLIPRTPSVVAIIPSRRPTILARPIERPYSCCPLDSLPLSFIAFFDAQSYLVFVPLLCLHLLLNERSILPRILISPAPGVNTSCYSHCAAISASVSISAALSVPISAADVPIPSTPGYVIWLNSLFSTHYK